MAQKKRRVITDITTRVGAGDERVYAYTFPSQQKTSGRYPIKIGMTRNRSAEHRIRQQIGASNVETPILLLEISCQDAGRLERRLHGSLRSWHMSDAPGKEWYQTSPEEIMSHLRVLDPRYVETFGQGVMVLVSWLWNTVCTLTSKLWQLFYWMIEANTRGKRRRVKRKYRRVKRRAEVWLARLVLCGGVIGIVLTAWLI